MSFSQGDLAIALRIRRTACPADELAKGQKEFLGHGLHLIEVEERVERLRVAG